MYKKNEYDKHFLVIGKDGEKLSMDGLKIEYDEVLNFDEIINPLLELIHKEIKVLIFIHGGLNNYNNTINKYKKKIPNIIKDGYYPIFIIWRSGLLECYKDHLFRIRQGRIHYHYTWFTWFFYLISDIGRGIFRLPFTLYFQLINDFKPYMSYKWNPDHKNSFAIYKILRNRMQTQKNENSVKVSWGEDKRTGIEKTIRIAALVLTYPIRVISTIFIDSFGTSAWSNMLRRTKTLFRSIHEFDIRNVENKQQKIAEILDGIPTGALYQFLNHLSVKLKTQSEYLKITLVGHSMGTIVLNQIIRELS